MLPWSPKRAKLLFAYTATPGPACHGSVPPAWPHASITGALPGRRHGLCRYVSLTEPSTAQRFIVHACFGRVGVVVALQSETLACDPIPVHVGQPMEQP